MLKLATRSRNQHILGRLSQMRLFRNPRLYEYLELKEGYTPRDLKKAYYQKAQKYHPDHGTTGSHQRFNQLWHAYDVLKDPILKKEYDNLSPLDYAQFVKQFDALYDSKSEVGIRSAEVIAGLLPITKSHKATVAATIQRFYDFFRPKQTLEDENNRSDQKLHTYIMLDNSASMYLFSDKYLKELNATVIEKGTTEGKTVSSVYIPENKRKLMYKRTYIGLSITQIREMMEDFLANSTLKNSDISIKLFSGQERLLFQTSPQFVLRQLYHTNQKDWHENNEVTALYDAIKHSISSVKNLRLTTFVVLTDGEDNYGSTTVEELEETVRELKEVSIVFIAMNLENVEALRRIAAAAKVGKVIRVGERYQTLSDAFSEVKSLVLAGSHVTSATEIKRIFRI